MDGSQFKQFMQSLSTSICLTGVKPYVIAVSSWLKKVTWKLFLKPARAVKLKIGTLISGQ